MRVGVVGLGASGRAICAALDDGIEECELVAAMARDEAKAIGFLGTLKRPVPFVTLDRLITMSDTVIEASTQEHLLEVAPATLRAGKQLVIMSSGALLDHLNWIDLAREHRGRIHVPSGAMAGLDALKGACVGHMDKVTLETRKPPRALAGAPWIVDQQIDLDAIKVETLIFEGTARAACRAFPANVNVVATLSLAGLGADRTTIKLYATPGLTRNLHRVTAEGDFGRVTLEIENVPSANPKTGKLSYLSVIALLRDWHAPLRVGT